MSSHRPYREWIPWLKSMLIFISLEACREKVGDPKRQGEVFCRYTLGKVSEEFKKKPLAKQAEEIREKLNNDRDLNDALGKPLEHLVSLASKLARNSSCVL